MGLPNEPKTLTVEQLVDLDRKLAEMRHDVNGHLSLIIAANELIRLKPETAGRSAPTLSEQPMKIKDALTRFSMEFDKLLGITRP